MKNEELEALGLNEEQVKGVLKLHNAEHGPVIKELETAKMTWRQKRKKQIPRERQLKT